MTGDLSKSEPPFIPYEPKRAGIQLHCNNSGGRWWLNEKDEQGLIVEGWLLHFTDFLGLHIDYAFLPNVSMQQALHSFSMATRYQGTERGCSCCGRPFSFSQYDENGKSI